MKENELQIGDYVKHRDYYDKVTGILGDLVYLDSGGMINSSKLEPISLTSIDMAKNGFRTIHDGMSRTIMELTVEQVINFDDDGIHWDLYHKGIGYTVADIKYVHQLQHILRLLGFEKEIVL